MDIWPCWRGWRLTGVYASEASTRDIKNVSNKISFRVSRQHQQGSKDKRDILRRGSGRKGTDMTTIGYARVSTTDQDLEIQVNALKAAGCEIIRSEKRSGTTTEGRAELQTVLDFLRPGDVLMVTRIDRLARSIGNLQDIVRALKAKGAALKATEQPRCNRTCNMGPNICSGYPRGFPHKEGSTGSDRP
jgi:hypothetical protein